MACGDDDHLIALFAERPCRQLAIGLTDYQPGGKASAVDVLAGHFVDHLAEGARVRRAWASVAH